MKEPILEEKDIETNKYKNEYIKHVQEIDEDGIVKEIRLIDPQMTFMVICYSEINDLKFLLEESGLFSAMKMSRDINILSNGHFLTMNDAQKEFIQTMAHEDHIEKDVIVTGPVGSGKTLLGLEAINIRLVNIENASFETVSGACRESACENCACERRLSKQYCATLADT